MPFPDPDERLGEELRLRIEFGVLLVIQLVMLVMGARYVWRPLLAWF